MLRSFAVIRLILVAMALSPLLAAKSSAQPVTWDGGGDGSSWSDPLNWAGDALPGADADVIIDDPAGEITVVHAAGATSIGSLTCAESFALSGGSLTLTSGASTIAGSLTVSSGVGLTTDGATAALTAAGAATIDGARLTALAGGSLSFPMASSFASGWLTVDGSGSAILLPAVTSLDYTRFFIRGGGVFAAPAGTTTYNHSGGVGVNEKRTIISVIGAGSVLDLSSLISFTANFSGLGGLRILAEATDNGVLNLSGLTSLAGGGTGANGGGPLELRVQTGGNILLDSLQNATGNGKGIAFSTDAALLSLPQLADAGRVNVSLPEGSVFDAPQLNELRDSSLVIPPGASAACPSLVNLLNTSVSLSGSGLFTAANLANIDHSRFLLTAGAAYALPAAVTAYDSSGGVGTNEKRTLFSADGPDTTLDLSPLKSITANYSGLGGILLLVEAKNGGAIDLSGMTSIAGGGSGANGGGPLEFRTSTGGLIDLSNVAGVLGNAAGVLFNFDDADLTFAALTSADRLHLRPPANAVRRIANLGTFQNGSVTLPDGATIEGGAVYTLSPGVTTYDSSGGNSTNEKRVLFSVDGEGSRLDLSSIQSLTAVFSGLGAIRQTLSASNLGEIDLSGLTSAEGGGSGVNGGGPLVFQTSSGGVIRMSSLATLAGVRAGILVDCAGTVRLGDSALQGVTLDIDGGRVHGGSLQCDAGSIIRGAGDIFASVVNSGQVQPGTPLGILRIEGDYTQSATGKLEIEIGGAAPIVGHDQLAITGAASLDGGLDVRFINAFEPSPTDFFAALSHASRTGSFASITGLDAGNGVILEPAYGARAFALVNDRVHVLFQTSPGDETFSFQFLTLDGFNYEIQYTDSLRPPSWLPLLQLTGDGSPQTVTDPAPPADHRYYRAVIENAP